MGSLPHKDYLWHAEQRQTLHVCATKMGVSSTYVCVCEMGRRKKKGRVRKKKSLHPECLLLAGMKPGIFYLTQTSSKDDVHDVKMMVFHFTWLHSMFVTVVLSAWREGAGIRWVVSPAYVCVYHTPTYASGDAQMSCYCSTLCKRQNNKEKLNIQCRKISFLSLRAILNRTKGFCWTQLCIYNYYLG